MGESFKTDFGEVQVTTKESKASKIKKFGKAAWEWTKKHKVEIAASAFIIACEYACYQLGRVYQGVQDLNAITSNNTNVTVVDNECGNVIHAMIPNDEVADLGNFQLLIKRFPDATPDVSITNF